MNDIIDADMTNPDADLALYAMAYPQAMQTLQELRIVLEEDGCRLSPVVGAEDIMAFERFFGISLPDEYQMFLRVVSNGAQEVGACVAGIPLRQELDLPRWQMLVEWVQKPFPLETEDGFGGYYRDMELTDEDREKHEGKDDDQIRYDKFIELRDEAGEKLREWSRCGTWQLTHMSFLVIHGKRKGTVWEEKDNWYPDDSGEHTLQESGSFLDWLMSQE